MGNQSLVVEGTVDKNAFLGYLEYVLLPTLDKDTVLVLDNWTVHYGDEVRELVQRFECELLYLPTYSPDLNPIKLNQPLFHSLFRVFVMQLIK